MMQTVRQWCSRQIASNRLVAVRKGISRARWYLGSIKGLQHLTIRVRYAGRIVHCPCCGWQGRAFLPHPPPHERKNSLCPECWSKERHRLLAGIIQERIDDTSCPIHVLEVSPGSYFGRILADLPNLEYVTVDLMDTAVSCRTDVCALPFADKSFDLMICYHVLEHVVRDRVAMLELRRVLADDGELFVQVPIVGNVTDEDSTVTDPLERLARFGQQDHVRQYGLDFFERLREAGFSIELLDAAQRLSIEEARHLGVDRDEIVTVCRRG